jgi:hypothetical protein
VIKRQYKEWDYYMRHTGEYLHDKDAPTPPPKVINEWKREAKEEFETGVVERARQAAAQRRNAEQ